jgi:hypothetical protein
MAAQWLASRPGSERPLRRSLRFDAIGITVTPAGRVTRLEHLENAF